MERWAQHSKSYRIIVPSRLLNADDYNWICDKLRPHAHKWKDIAHGLGFHAAELNCIEADPKNLINAPTSYLYAILDSWLQWAPGDDRGSRDYATVRSLSTAVDKAGLGVLAQDLRLLIVDSILSYHSKS